MMRRHALGLWLCGIALLGAFEFHRAGYAQGSFSPSLVAWLWLAGSLSCGAIGIVMLVRGCRETQ